METTSEHRACWINTVCLDHVRTGVAGGFTQANHGASHGVRRLREGDAIAFYSPRTSLTGRTPVQQFTAYGVVVGGEPYRVRTEDDDFPPWRMRLDFRAVSAADVRPLIGHLSFIRDTRRWGLPFRRGLFRIPGADMELIERAMGLDPVG